MPLSPAQGHRHPQLSIRFKFCGICRLQDAIIAAELGASMLGIMQVKRSKRYLPLPEAAELAKQIKASPAGAQADLVAVVADAARDELDEIIRAMQPDLLQFHGDESDGFCKSFGLSYIKAIRATSAAEIRREAQKYPSAAYLLLDSPGNGSSDRPDSKNSANPGQLDGRANPGEFGGSGTSFDWAQIPTELAARLIIAGGLNPDKVGELLARITPAGLDVSSGIESQPGMKDAAKMKSFAAAVARHQA